MPEIGALRAGPTDSDLRRAGALMAFAGMSFLLLITFLEASYPGYNVHTNTVSDLFAIGTATSLVGEPVGFAVAVSWMAGAYLLFRKSGRKGLLLLNVLPGAGLLLAVLSPENVNIAVHSVGAVVAFVPGPVAATLSYRIVGPPFKYFALGLGVLSLFGAVMEFGAYQTSFFQQTLGPGGWERVILYPLLVWLAGLGGYLMSRAGQGLR